MARAVLDASALLALLNDEPGGNQVTAQLPGAAISAVNLSEAMARLLDAGVREIEAVAVLDGLGLEIHPFDGPAALATARLRVRTRLQGLSLGDRACLALGQRLRLPVLTADRVWKKLRLGVRVRLIRGNQR